jgi:predicted TIM-barrel fold metal-dependent hydrolase
MTNPYVLITADTHAGGSHAQYRECLDPKYRDDFDEWRGGYRNPAEAHYAVKKLRNWDLDIRTKDQNSQGVVGEVVYPNTVPPFFKESIVTAQPPRPEDYEKALAGTRAHNRWLVDFCGEDPDRRAGIGVILPNNIDEAIKDVEFIAKSGLRGGVLLPLIPEDCQWLKPLYHSDWEPLFAAIADHDLVMNQHTGQGLPRMGEGPAAQAVWMSEVAFFAKRGFAHLLLSGVFERYPKLKYILTESGCAWAPEMLEQLDRLHYGMLKGSIGEMDYSKTEWVLKESPSYYAKRNCWYGASFPSTEDIGERDAVGVENICWGNDYPHYEGTFPYNTESLQLTFKTVPENERRMILGENAAKLYNFDMGKMIANAKEVGPTAAQIEAPLDVIPEDSECYLFTNAREAQVRT